MDHPHQPFAGSLWKRPGCGGNIYEPDPSNDAQLFFSPFIVLISMLNIAITSAYIICKPIQLRSVFQFLSQCLSFNILICSSLIWDLQASVFVFPSRCCLKETVQVSSLSRCAAETTQLLHPGYFSSFCDSVFARLLYWGDSFSAVDKPAVVRMALHQEREREVLW